jgi:tRNA (guanine-N7-)-methyltransferase
MTQSIVFPTLDQKVKLEDLLLVVPLKSDLGNQFVIPANFVNENKVKLEFCSGNGEWIINRSQREPYTNWIAVEMRLDRLRKIWKKARRFNLDNLLCVYGEAFRCAKHFIMQGSIDEIYINFPDPWPKRRHAKNRLIQKKFLDELYRILKDDGKVIFVTDDLTYKEEAQSEFLKHFGFKKVNVFYENYGSSFFKRLWQERGKMIYYQTFQKVDMPKIIKLDASMSSLLDWSSAKSEAQNADTILWQFDFGLSLPLEDTCQYHSLQIALDQFKDQVLASFNEKTKGAILHKGPIPFFERNFEEWLRDRFQDKLCLSSSIDQKGSFIHKLHSRDVFLDFLKLLMIALPHDVDPFLFLDLSDMNLKEQIQYLHSDALWDFKIALKGSIDAFASFKWEGDEITVTNSQKALRAVLVPLSLSDSFLDKLIDKINDLGNEPFRICFEDKFNMQWDGLEYLYVDLHSLSSSGQRMLKGFEAAGGNILEF